MERNKKGKMFCQHVQNKRKRFSYRENKSKKKTGCMREGHKVTGHYFETLEVGYEHGTDHC